MLPPLSIWNPENVLETMNESKARPSDWVNSNPYAPVVRLTRLKTVPTNGWLVSPVTRTGSLLVPESFIPMRMASASS